MIYFIIIAALLVSVVLMNDFGWADLTGNKRNNVVFETRNKSYGAYEIRQKYSNRLIVAFFGSLGILTLAAFSPKFFTTTEKHTVVEKEPKGPIIHTFDNRKKEEIKKEEIFENKKVEKQQAPKKQDVSTVAANKPIATDKKQELDTVQKPKDAFVSNVNHIGKDTGVVAINPLTPKGGEGDGDCIDCPENIIKNGGELPITHVTKQAEFDYQNYFRKKLRIPEMVYDLGITKTKVYVDFVLDEEGNVTKVKIRKGEIPMLNDEVQRVAASMPKWSPAEYNHHKVKVRMTIPVSITLK